MIPILVALILGLGVGAFLGGCTTSQVVLRDHSGNVATCGPYYNDGGAVAYREAQCIADYQRQGFERAPR